jgi:TetR/AcrR family transcriptional regulator, transcriptional repressor for nem operon
MELFWSQGYNGTSTRELEHALGIGSGSLYAAFGSKERLFVAALDRYIDQWAPLMQAARESVAAGTPVKSAVRDLFRAVHERISAEKHAGCLAVKAAMERAGQDPEVDERVHRLFAGLESVLIEVIARGQERGELSAERTPQELARFLVMTLHGLRVLRLVHPDPQAAASALEVALSCLG